MDIWWILIPISISPFIYLGWRELFIKYIRPAQYYKLVVYDHTEEYTFYERKKNAVLVQDKKGFVLFYNKQKETGEFYTVSTDDEDSPSKRDNTGMVTFYYWRNNSNPLKFNEEGDPVKIGKKKTIVLSDINIPLDIKSNVQIEVDNDASLMFKVYNTKMFNASLMEDDKKPFVFSKQAIIVIVLLILVAMFWLAKTNGWI